MFSDSDFLVVLQAMANRIGNDYDGINFLKKYCPTRKYYLKRSVPMFEYQTMLKNIVPSDVFWNLYDLECVDMLPSELPKLTFFDEFNQPIEPGVLPSGLVELRFGAKFNQPIEPGVLPDGLKILRFCVDFNQNIQPNVLPQCL